MHALSLEKSMNPWSYECLCMALFAIMLSLQIYTKDSMQPYQLTWVRYVCLLAGWVQFGAFHLVCRQCCMLSRPPTPFVA